MALNCRPGELAVVKRGFTSDHYVGRVVTVLDEFWPEGADEAPDAGPAWSIRFPEPVHRLDGSVHDIAACPDAWLMPIRDPGDDAVDEMLRHVGAPLRDEELALIFPPEVLE